MSDPSELYNNYPNNLPLLSIEELQALHEYNEKLIKTEAEADLRCMIQQPVTSFGEVSSNTSSSGTKDTGVQWNSWRDRDDEITRALCEDQGDKKARWEFLYDQWNVARRETSMKFGADEENSSKSPCLDPCLQTTGTTAVQHHKDQVQSMNAFLHLQDQQARSQQPSSGHGSNKHVDKDQCQKVRPSIDQNSLPPGDVTAPNLSRVAESTDVPTAPAPGPLRSQHTPMHHPQTDISPAATPHGHDTFRINLPSVSILTQTTDGYSHPTIHFPSLTYIVDTPTNDQDHNHHNDSLPEYDQSQLQPTSKSNDRLKADLSHVLVLQPRCRMWLSSRQ